ncbi:MAG: ATP synthase F0 subunit B [Planctomycetota bacterium]|nr:MAG: ATP synthase F0 subunit B [Planctomycetota bacterium]
MKNVLIALAAAILAFSWAAPSPALAQEAEAPSAAEHADEHAAAGAAGHGDAHGGHGAHDPGHGNAQPGLEHMAEFRTDLALYTFVVFLLLLAVLSAGAWPKISKALVEREKRIEADLAAAEAKHEDAKRLLAQHEAKLAGAAAEVKAILEEARRDAEHTGQQIVAEAREAAQKERERAVREIEFAADHAMKNLAETSANLAVELAGKVIRESINPAKQQELVRTALARLNASNN